MICKSDEDDRRPVIMQSSQSRDKADLPHTAPVLPSVDDSEKKRLNALENVYLEMKGELNVLRQFSSSQLQASQLHQNTYNLPPQTPVDFSTSSTSAIPASSGRSVSQERLTPESNSYNKSNMSSAQSIHLKNTMRSQKEVSTYYVN